MNTESQAGLNTQLITEAIIELSAENGPTHSNNLRALHETKYGLILNKNIKIRHSHESGNPF